jgi:deoxyribonuclease-4
MPKKELVRFGSAGIPLQCKGSSLDAIECSKELGLRAMELEFVRGVKLKEENARKLKPASGKADVSLSSHAPYWVNCCSSDKSKRETSKRNIFLAAQASSWAGAGITVFHPGYYQKKTSRECFTLAKETLQNTLDSMKRHKVEGVMLGAETVGKKSQYGGLDECIELQQKIRGVMVVLDFAHLHARGDFPFRKEADYANLFKKLEKELPGYLKNFHAHFSCINYSEKGELSHLPLEGKNQPPYKPLMKVLAENGYGGTIISESPKLEYDAVKMREEYLKFL